MPFTEEQAPFFFGRQGDCELITANLLASRLTLLYGPSGVGKSSVLNAGVAYHLRKAARESAARGVAPESIVVVFRTWRDDPVKGLERAIAHEAGFDVDGRTFVDRLARWTERLGADLLVILDQFEEYFLYHGTDSGADSFGVEFPRAVNQASLRVSFLVSMREDSIAKVDFFKGSIPYLFDNRLRIDHLDRDEARDAIVKPLDVYNRVRNGAPPMSIEPELVERVLDEVTAGRVTTVDAGRGGLPPSGGDAATSRIETPYLQLVLTRLWQEEQGAGSSLMRTATLRALGGADRIVATHLDAALASLSARQRDVAAEIFQHLVTPARTKIALSVDDLAGYGRYDPSELRALLLELSGGEIRILVPVAPALDQPVGERYQIFHDVLAGAVLDWRNKYVKAREQKAAEAVAAQERARAEKEARDATRLRRLLALVVSLFVVTVAAISIAWWQTARTTRVRRALTEQVAALQKIAGDQYATARQIEERAAASREAALKAETEKYQLLAKATEAQSAGKTVQADSFRQQAVAAANRATNEQQTATVLGDQAKRARQAGDDALKKADQLLARSEPSKSPIDIGALPGARAVSVEPRPADTSPAIATPPPSGTATKTADAAPPGNSLPPRQIRGDYQEPFRRAMDAKNRKRWKESADALRTALQMNPSDTGEMIPISGFGNIEPYVPKYYLGLALKNMGDCDGALKSFADSEADNAIQKTGLYKSLVTNRDQCLGRK